MTFPTTSFIASTTIRDALVAGTTTLDVDADTIKLALYSNSITGCDINLDPCSYATTPFTSNECTGTGWTGPQTLANADITHVTDTGIMFDADDVSVSSTTISTAAFGCLIYDDTESTIGDAGLVVVYFGSGSGYTTNNGTFGITWDTAGIFRITLHA